MPSTCINCGAVLRPNARFCGRCGTRQPPGGRSKTTFMGAFMLEIRLPNGQTRTETLVNSPITIGREPPADIIIGDSYVSARHAQLTRQGSGYTIADLHSSNGTVVNGQPLPPPQLRALRHGDVIRIGDRRGNSVSLTYRDASAAATPVGQAIVRQLNWATLPSPAVIGRDRQCAINLAHQTVSWQHAQIERQVGRHGDGVLIRDLGSTNGTFVNGQPIKQRKLQQGDVIQIGPFRLTYSAAGLTQATSLQHFRLDAVRLRREVPHKRGTKVILNDISLSIHPREFVALVGGSGAGKSTLLKALCGVQRAKGQVLLNGDDFYRQFGLYCTQLGYVPQDDIIHRGLPVSHALQYAARLRLPPETPNVEQHITAVLRTVDMEAHKGTVVKDLSGGQRKRVSIGVELLADPGVFFLDEPTSGLDPGLEKKMMYTMRKLADEGRTIVLVTHATANIDQCDLVAFMSEGRLVYYGPPRDALQFFGATDYADIYTEIEPRPPVPAPANGWVDQLRGWLGAAPPAAPPAPTPPPQRTPAEWEQKYQRSPYYRQYVRDRQQKIGVGPGASAAGSKLTPKRARLVAQARQFILLTARYLELVLRDKLSLFILLAVAPLIGLLFALIAKPHDLVGKPTTEIAKLVQYAPVNIAQKLLLMMALAATLIGLFGAAYELVRERAIYDRERMVGVQTLPYLLSKMGVLCGFALVQALLLLGAVALRVELPTDGIIMPAPLEMYVTLVLAGVCGVMMGLLISAVAQGENMVIYVVLFVLFVQIIFAGAIFKLETAMKPVAWLTTTHWTLSALGDTVNMDHLATLHRAVGRHMPFDLAESSIAYAFAKAHLLSRWAILAGFSVVYGAATWGVLRRQNRG